MATAKVVSLSVRPLQASHLCFEVGGILGECKAQLGDPVAAFDFAAFYLTLKSFGTSLASGDLSRLVFDSFAIHDFAQPSTLAALRAEGRKVALNKAIDARQNAFNSKYINIPAIVSRMLGDYSPSISDSKPNRLKRLSTLSQQQADELQKAYASDNRMGVVKTTNSKLDSKLDSSGSSTTTGNRDGKSNELGDDAFTTDVTFPPPPLDFQGRIHRDDPTIHGSFREGRSSESSSEKSASTGSASQKQEIANTDYGYRIPFLECQAQNERAQISLIDERFTQFMAGQSVANLGFTELSRMFTNELNSIDNDVFQLQVAYLNTILMSPISGTVTGIYKNPGDAVMAGEPVVRVENNADIYLVATLIFRGPISIGSKVRVKTTRFEVSGATTSVGGPVVAVRGQREDDQWEVIVKCKNLDGGGNPIFPLGYHFDFDDTTVEIL
jgi:hypothetical protein